MTPAGAGLEPAEPQSQQDAGEEGHRGQNVVHPIPWRLGHHPEENGPTRQDGADTEQRGRAPGAAGPACKCEKPQ